MELRSVCNGDYLAGSDGLLYREHPDGSVMPETIYPAGGNNRQAAVVIGKSGERHTVLLSHLIADGFGLEHPDGCTKLIHIDGNGYNNRPENLAWVSPAEFNRHRRKFFKNVPCPICGKPRANTGRLAEMCVTCRAKQRSVEAIRETRSRRVNKYSKIPTVPGDYRALDYLPYLRQGFTLGDVSDIFGCSRQNVSLAVRVYVNHLKKEGLME